MIYEVRFRKEIPRPGSDLIKNLERYSTPDICDAVGVFDSMDDGIKPWVTQNRIVGPAITVKVPIGEGGIIPRAIEVAQEGDIIVIAGKGNTLSAYWGDQRSKMALARGVAGVIIDGAFRDCDDCEKIGLPVYAKGLTTGSSGKAGAGEVNVPISCGGIVVNPGDIIVADRNGICCIPWEHADELVACLEAKFGLDC